MGQAIYQSGLPAVAVELTMPVIYAKKSHLRFNRFVKSMPWLAVPFRDNAATFERCLALHDDHRLQFSQRRPNQCKRNRSKCWAAFSDSVVQRDFCVFCACLSSFPLLLCFSVLLFAFPFPAFPCLCCFSVLLTASSLFLLFCACVASL